MDGKTRKWRDDITLTKEQEQLILGGILGDAGIRMGNPKSHNARITFTQSIKQYEYCTWKYGILKTL